MGSLASQIPLKVSEKLIGFISTLEHNILVLDKEKLNFHIKYYHQNIEFCLLKKICRKLGCFCNGILLLYNYSINGMGQS